MGELLCPPWQPFYKKPDQSESSNLRIKIAEGNTNCATNSYSKIVSSAENNLSHLEVDVGGDRLPLLPQQWSEHLDFSESHPILVQSG